MRPRCSLFAAAPLWSGLARRLAATRSGAWLLGAVASVRHNGGRHTQHVLVVILHTPLEGTVWEESSLQRLAGERTQAVAVTEHRVERMADRSYEWPSDATTGSAAQAGQVWRRCASFCGRVARSVAAHLASCPS